MKFFIYSIYSIQFSRYISCHISEFLLPLGWFTSIWVPQSIPFSVYFFFLRLPCSISFPVSMTIFFFCHDRPFFSSVSISCFMSIAYLCLLLYPTLCFLKIFSHSAYCSYFCILNLHYQYVQYSCISKLYICTSKPAGMVLLKNTELFKENNVPNVPNVPLY